MTPEEKLASREGKITKASLLYIIVDEHESDIQWKNNALEKLFMNSKHLGITIIYTSLYPMSMEPRFRIQMEWAFIFGYPEDKNDTNTKKLYEHYVGVVPYFYMFEQIMDICTGDFGCVVIDNNAKSYDIRTCSGINLGYNKIELLVVFVELKKRMNKYLNV